MDHLTDTELQKIVDEVVSSLMREMPSHQSALPVSQPAERIIETGVKVVALGADHGGYQLKETLKTFLEEKGYQVVDCGTKGTESVDYPDFAREVAEQVASGAAWRGIMIDGAGIGSCMAANKVHGVRAAMCYDHSTALNSREHNDANLLTLGAGMIGANLAKQITETFLKTEFGGGRHARRVEKIMAIEI
jgi:RpiB/LacA/LacB family sugar-phosphate isomerase